MWREVWNEICGCRLRGPLVGEEIDGFWADVEKTQRSPETCPLLLSMKPLCLGLVPQEPKLREGQRLAQRTGPAVCADGSRALGPVGHSEPQGAATSRLGLLPLHLGPALGVPWSAIPGLQADGRFSQRSCTKLSMSFVCLASFSKRAKEMDGWVCRQAERGQGHSGRQLSPTPGSRGPSLLWYLTPAPPSHSCSQVPPPPSLLSAGTWEGCCQAWKVRGS